MKLKTILLGLSAAALMGGSAFAQTTTLYIVGSTAFRAPATIAMLAYLSANSSDGVVHGGSNATSNALSSLLGAGDGYFTNTQGTLVIKTNWTGSAAGLVDVTTANATGDKFIPTTGTTLTAMYIPGVTAGSGSTNIGTLNLSNTELDVPNVTFCDSFDTSIAATLSGATIANGHPVDGATKGSQLAAILDGSNVKHAGTSAGAGNQDAVGIIPFAWYMGNTTGATTIPTFTNITQQQAAALIATPEALSNFTGVTADSVNGVFLIGRNEDSGTRLAAFAESQLGFGPGCDQFELTFSGTSTTGSLTTQANGTVSNGLNTGGVTSGTNAVVTGGQDFEADAQLYTEQYIGFNSSGHSGYASGGDVAKVLLADNKNPGSLNIDGDGGNEYFVGYLGFSDGYALTNPSSGTTNGYALSYNGVAPTVANIENGTYSFWAYEHMYYLTSNSNALSTTAAAAADAIADNIFNTYANTDSNGITSDSPAAGNPPPAGIKYGSMNVSRAQEGAPLGVPTGNY